MIEQTSTAWEFFTGVGIGLIVMYYAKDWFKAIAGKLGRK